MILTYLLSPDQYTRKLNSSRGSYIYKMENIPNDSVKSPKTDDDASNGLNEEKRLTRKRKSISPQKEQGRLSPSKQANSENSKSEKKSNSENSCASSGFASDESDSSNYSRQQKSKPEKILLDNIIDKILKIADDSAIILGPEAYNDINRNKYARFQESNGEIELHVICNSLSQPLEDQILIWLVELRNVISVELPDMNRNYITRLVFDPRHRNLILVKQGSVIGGICFRMFPVQDFSEIVFLAISSSKHVNGYGSHMMNHLKDYHIRHGVHNLLTYAAYEAFGYFEKQGFNDRITLDKTIYDGYINLYEGAKLMECKLDPRITYTEISEVVSRQKKIVKRLIEENEKSSHWEIPFERVVLSDHLSSGLKLDLTQ